MTNRGGGVDNLVALVDNACGREMAEESRVLLHNLAQTFPLFVHTIDTGTATGRMEKRKRETRPPDA